MGMMEMDGHVAGGNRRLVLGVIQGMLMMMGVMVTEADVAGGKCPNQLNTLNAKPDWSFLICSVSRFDTGFEIRALAF